jgi:hypothetical protein
MELIGRGLIGVLRRETELHWVLDELGDLASSSAPWSGERAVSNDEKSTWYRTRRRTF